jgi:DNA-binding response OmpR family regulator
LRSYRFNGLIVPEKLVAHEGVGMRKPIVLVVDDDEGIVKLLRIVVEMWGGEVYVAMNGLEALAYLHGITPDLIMLDIMMPGLNGIELCGLMRKHDNAKDAYILVMSAHGSMDNVGNVLDAGASDFWWKPMGHDWMGKLRNLLKQVIEEQSIKPKKDADNNSA